MNYLILNNLIILKVYNEPKIMELVEGDSTKIDCSFEKHQSDLTVTWYKDEKLIKSDGTSLSLENVNVGDAANYKCKVQSKLQTVFSPNFELQVYKSTELMITPSGITNLLEGMTRQR